MIWTPDSRIWTPGRRPPGRLILPTDGPDIRDLPRVPVLAMPSAAMMQRQPMKPAAAGNYVTVVLATAGLVDFYETNEASGSTAPDSVGTNTGTLNTGVTKGAAGLTAGGGTDYSFASGNSGVSSATAFVPGGSNEFSIEMLFKASTFSTTQVQLGVFGADGNTGVILWVYNKNTIAFEWNNSESYFSVTTIVTGAVFHIVLTYDGTQVRGYQNGVIRYPATTKTARSFTGGWVFGGNSFHHINLAAYQGVEGKLAFYNVALDATTITNHYDAITVP